MNPELAYKEKRVRALMEQKGLDALLIRGVSTFAWLTGGASNFVSVNSADGNSWLLYTPQAKYVICNNIEATRLQAEEELEAQGFQFEIIPWEASDDGVGRLAHGLTLGADGVYPNAQNVAGDLARERALLMEGERDLLRRLAT